MAEGVIAIEDDDSESDVIVISDDEENKPSSSSQECMEHQRELDILQKEKEDLKLALKLSLIDSNKSQVCHQDFAIQPSTSRESLVKHHTKKIDLERTWCRIRKEREKQNPGSNNNTINEQPVVISDESDGEFSDELPDLDDICNNDLEIKVTYSAKTASTTNNATTPIKTGPVFDNKSRAKLASILKSAKLKIAKKSSFNDGKEENESKFEFSKTDDGDSKNSEEKTSSPSTNRHFLDFFQSENSETSSSEPKINLKYSEVPPVPVAENSKRGSIFVTSSPSPKRQKKAKRKKQIQTPNDSSDLTPDFHVFDTNSDFKLTRKEKLKFPNDNDVDSLVRDFSMLCINSVMVCLEDDNEDALIQGLEIFNDFAHKYKPSAGLVNEVFNRCLILAKSVELISKGFNTLLYIHHTYPDLLKISWDSVKEMLDQVGIGRGMAHQDTTIIIKMSSLLELTIICYEDNFYQCDLADQRSIRKSYAFRFLSHDLVFERNVKHVINIVICLLTSGEFSEIDVDYLSSLRPLEQKQQKIKQNPHQIQMYEVSKILPKLQKILEISVNISSSCGDAAKAIAIELLKSYIYLPNVLHKILLLQTIQSDLLRFKLIQLVLENHCEGTLPGLDFPSNLNSIVECYFKALPPKNILTPPTTPQSEDEEQSTTAVLDSYSPAAVEELAVLLYYLIYSYLKCVQKKSHIALRRRARYTKAELYAMSPEIQENLTIFPQHVENLREHFLMLTDITAKTQEYLKKMLCFSNMKY